MIFSLRYRKIRKKIKFKRDKILENFFNKEYFCYMTGFIAGMPFLGDLDENMRDSTFRNTKSESSKRISRY